MRTWRCFMALAALLAVTAGSCGAEPPKTTTTSASKTPSPPTLQGTVLVQVEAEIAAVTGDAVSTLASDVKRAALSPDGRTLAYSTNTQLILRDMVAGANKPLAIHNGGKKLTSRGTCMAWSPDSRRLAAFAAEDKALYVITPDGAASIVDTPKSAVYVKTQGTIIPRPDPNDPGVTVTSNITCPSWLDNNRLVFDRVATMPSRISETNGQFRTVPSDTTTIADLSGGQPKLSDATSQWDVTGACGGNLIIRNSDGAQFLVNSAELTDPNSVAKVGTKLPTAAEYGFIAGPCDVLLIDDAVRRYETATGKLSNLATLTGNEGAPLRLAPNFMAWQPGGATVFIWGGTYTQNGSLRSSKNMVSLFDVTDGGRTDITVTTKDGWRVHYILGWIP